MYPDHGVVSFLARARSAPEVSGKTSSEIRLPYMYARIPVYSRLSLCGFSYVHKYVQMQLRYEQRMAACLLVFLPVNPCVLLKIGESERDRLKSGCAEHPKQR